MPFPTAQERAYKKAASEWFDLWSIELLITLEKTIESDLKSSYKADGIGDILARIEYLQQTLFRIKKFAGRFGRIFNEIDFRVEHDIGIFTRRKIGIEAIGLGDQLTNAILSNRAAMNEEMWSELYRSHFDDIRSITQRAFKQGLSTKEIVSELQEKTGVNRTKARFWAQDQTGWAFADITRARQTSAGFPGYIWRTKKDGRVRDNHGDLEGLFFLWAKGASVDGRMLHPGQDYNCRCFAEPAFDEFDADTPDEIARSMAQIERKKAEISGR